MNKKNYPQANISKQNTTGEGATVNLESVVFPFIHLGKPAG